MNVQSWVVLALVLVVAVACTVSYWRRPNPCAGCRLRDACTKRTRRRMK